MVLEAKESVPQNSVQAAFLARAKQAISAGWNINDRDAATNETFLTQAAYDDNVDAANYLLDHGANINATNKDHLTPLMCAALMGRAKFVEVLLDKGAYVNMRDRDGYTDMVNLLLEHKPDLNLRSWVDGMTALMRAAFDGNLNAVSWLVKNGAALD